MGLEVVIDEIRENGKREADRIRKETDAEVGSILKAAQEKAERIKLAAEQDIQKQTGISQTRRHQLRTLW